MTTKRLYPPPAAERPLAARIQVPVTHVMLPPFIRRLNTKPPQSIEMNAHPDVIRQLIVRGWVVVEDRTVKV